MKAKVKATVDLYVEIGPGEIANALAQHITHEYGSQDDAGTDWYTDDQGQVYFAANPEWKPFPKDVRLATLVDAMNILSIGHALKMPERTEIETLRGEVERQEHLIETLKAECGSNLARAQQQGALIGQLAELIEKYQDA